MNSLYCRNQVEMYHLLKISTEPFRYNIIDPFIRYLIFPSIFFIYQTASL